MLVDLANHGLSFGLVAWLGGSIVSGQMVSAEDYWNGVAAEVESSVEDTEISAPLAGVFRDIAVQAREDFKTPIGEGEPPTYLHLKDARAYVSGQPPMPENRGVWLRAPISRVDGFALGRLGRAEDAGT